MAMALRTEIDLPTLRVSLDLATSDVVFATVRGREEPAEVVRCRHDDLGLPRSVYDRVQDDVLHVPPALVGDLRRAISRLGTSPVRPYNALWLEIPSPRGLLPVVPWERLLAPLGRPLYRLPFHPVRPRRPADGLNVALGVHSPSDDDVVDITARLVEQYRRVPRVRVHVFTGAPSWPVVDDLLAPQVADGTAIVHRPAGTGTNVHATSAPLVTNPWLTWVLGALGGGRLDVVHLVAPGHLADGRGALALPDPTSTADAGGQLVESVELVELLTRVGAVALTLGTPLSVQGTAGLREVADDVARLRPGLTAVHDLVADPGAEQLGSALRTVLSPTDTADVLPAMTAWLNPLFVDAAPGADPPDREPEPAWTSEMRLLDDGSSALLPAATRTAAAEQPEAWVASAARSIEQLQMAWTPAVADRPADPAAVEALARVARLLDAHLPPDAVGPGSAPTSGGSA